MVRPLTERIERPSADTTPAVTVEFKAERVSDRDHELAAAQALGIAERGITQIARAIGPQQREVGVRVDAEHMGVGDEAFDVAQPDLFRRSDHMAVGQHQAVWRDDDAGAEPAAFARVAHFRSGFDANHSRPDAFGHADDGVGIGVEQSLVVCRSGFGRRRQVVAGII